ncbi:hypothetical protein CJO81_00950 [Ralstonia solanacearum]|uniref:hypothetical protein n=1 Tax=Ralstonia solanacearum species complex TaxID=3116862 RepID=UPI00078C8173|nr:MULTISPECIES: hypothetical protein [Ralstonia solanacearum species complex]AMP36247.1 hypothetical protein LBM2029_01235 [Ralstonia solanacearum]AXV85042.1 hypothetical protein CJO78_01285 [Ralstonia solanacearum]AXV99465.1 hypothetical protein CJO81_00950 [Ralstonia solanacearum]AXW04533.1 hypothetical protein CJO82_00940 [Ralstonia solanacearum]AXW22286.1 hypothetical protein CJO86_00940 [Ralstonia solanacearum]
MTALQQFQSNIDAADQLVAMYRELRNSRDLGGRGRLDAQNQDLLWLPRSAVVAAISALDTYVHSVVKERLPLSLAAGAAMPEPLADQLAQIITVKNAATFRKSAALILAADTSPQLLRRLEDDHLQFQSYQAPEKIMEAYHLVGEEQIFERVSDLWSGPNTTADNLKRRLAGYVQRRNQIAHEGDLEKNGTQRPMQPEYAIRCREYVGNLVARLNDIVYGA